MMHQGLQEGMGGFFHIPLGWVWWMVAALLLGVLAGYLFCRGGRG